MKCYNMLDNKNIKFVHFRNVRRYNKMVKNEFEEIKSNLDKYKYTSLTYIEYENIENYKLVELSEDIIIIYGL